MTVKEAGIIKHIVYYDFGGSHSSVTAAAVHTGRLTPNQVPSSDDLMALPYLDKTSPGDFGKFKYFESDAQGNAVYVLGTKSSHAGNLLKDLVNIMGIADQYLFLDTIPYVNNTLRVGGWLSRAASLPSLGRPLVMIGLKQAYAKLCAFVNKANLNMGVVE